MQVTQARRRKRTLTTFMAGLPHILRAWPGTYVRFLGSIWGYNLVLMKLQTEDDDEARNRITPVRNNDGKAR